jgi:hypothetical protein
MTNKIKSVTYGLGGYDETKPDNNIVETLYYTDEEEAEIAELEAATIAAAEVAATKAANKAAIYAKLGLTEEEVDALLS